VSARGARALACLLAVGLGSGVQAGSRPGSEYHVKAEHLLNFVRLTQWPAAAGPAAPLPVCVLGESPLASMIQWSAPRSVQNRRVVVRRITAATSDRAGCEVLFITRDAASELEPLLASLPPGVLTVTEIATRDRLPSVINMVLVGDRVAFDVNTEAANRAGLTLSARLLGLARAVDGRQLRRD
jgi:hypothetical protein